MKKFVIFLVIIVIIVSIIGIKYYSYQADLATISQENQEFEQYTNKEVYGIDVATVINKAVDKNTKNNIEKDEQGFFIQNDENSIEVEVKIQEGEDEYIFKMEQINGLGTEQFVQYFINFKFKCSDVEYHEKTGRIKYMLFEQIATSEL